MNTIKISELLDALDGDGIIWTDSFLTEDALKRMGLSHDTRIKIGTNPLVAELLDALKKLCDSVEWIDRKTFSVPVAVTAGKSSREVQNEAH